MPKLMLTDIIFIGASGLAIFSALMVILMKNAVRSAMFLVLTLFCVAVLYVLLNAQFIAAVQVIVYAGAIMVLFLFVIMLLNIGETSEAPAKHWLRKAVGYLFGAVLLAQIGLVVIGATVKGAAKGGVTQPEWFGSTELLARALFTRYVFPFEAISILLLIAIIGAVTLAKRKL